MPNDILTINRAFYDGVYHPKSSRLKYIWVKYFSFSVRVKVAPVLSELKDCRGKKILEIGFGWGLNIIALAKSNRVYGVEISEAAIHFVKAIAEKKNLNNVQLALYQGTGAFFFQDKFDMVISSHVLEHVPDDLEFLKQNYHALDANGLMALQIPIRQDLDYDKDPNHAREYTEGSITAVLQNTGFRVMHVVHSGYSLSYFDESGNGVVRVFMKICFLLFSYRQFLRFERRFFGRRYAPTQALFICRKD